VVQAIVEEVFLWTITMEGDIRGPRVNITVACSLWEEVQETMDLKVAELKTWMATEEEVQDRAILISIKIFLTEVELISEATIHLKLVVEVLEGTVLVNWEALVINLLHQIQKVNIMGATVQLEEQDQ